MRSVQGAADFIEKPWDDDKMLASIYKALELRRSKLEIASLRDKQKHLSEKIDHEYDFLMGTSPEMGEIYKTIDKVAATDASVLILGENGTGKEVIAREIHRRSARSREVFIGVDLGSLSATLFESELFGHIKGAFTDAKEDRPGRFEIASGGTLFLDEIANLPSMLQSKLLTVLQSREVTRIGSNRPVPVDIRLICATNSQVNELATQGKFRQDLLYRINTIQLEIPPLRERKEDIPLLLEYFLKKYALKYGKSGFKTDKAAMEKLQQYNWPGNVRELQHMAEKAVILGDGPALRIEDFFFGARPGTQEIPVDTLNLEQLEKAAILKAIDKNKGNVTRAVKELGISQTGIVLQNEKV